MTITPVLAFFQNIGTIDYLIILAVVLLLFGSTRLPALARSLGMSVSEFKKGVREGEAETPAAAKPAPTNPPDKK